MCLACRRMGGPLCPECRRDLTPVPPTSVGGVPVASAFAHAGAAVSLVHRLKYEGIEPAAGLLARAMAPLVPAAARSLVPIPRATVRRWRYGVDSAACLADALGTILELPVVAAFGMVFWHPRHAGRGRNDRRPRSFRSVVAGLDGAVIVDDVLTTGATLQGAVDELGTAIAGVTATRAGGTSLFMRASN